VQPDAEHRGRAGGDTGDAGRGQRLHQEQGGGPQRDDGEQEGDREQQQAQQVRPGSQHAQQQPRVDLAVVASPARADGLQDRGAGRHGGRQERQQQTPSHSG